jgi:hypothetical protein
LFERLAHEVEDLFFVYVITREPTRDFERNFARWAGEIRRVLDNTGLQTIVDNRFVPAKAELSARFDDAFARMNANSIQQYRLKYVLAKLTQWLELQAYGEAEGTKWLSRFAGVGFEIEHIFPQQPGDDAVGEFGSYEDPNIIYRLGNLTLVEKSLTLPWVANLTRRSDPSTRSHSFFSRACSQVTQTLA